MNWLLPIAIPPRGVVRTIGEPSPKNLTAARQKRWRVSAKGRAYYKRYMRRKGKRDAANARSRKWSLSPKGRAWLEKNRERLNAYHLLRYHTDGGRRRAYLNAKQREYRSRKSA